MDEENVYYLGENGRKKTTNREQSLLLHVNIASFPRNRKKMFSDARNLASMVFRLWQGIFLYTYAVSTALQKAGKLSFQVNSLSF